MVNMPNIQNLHCEYVATHHINVTGSVSTPVSYTHLCNPICIWVYIMC